MIDEKQFAEFISRNIKDLTPPEIKDFIRNDLHIGFTLVGDPRSVYQALSAFRKSGPILTEDDSDWIPINCKLTEIVGGTHGYIECDLHPSPFPKPNKSS